MSLDNILQSTPLILALYGFLIKLGFDKIKNWSLLISGIFCSAIIYFKQDFKTVLLLSAILGGYEIFLKRKTRKYLLEWLPWLFLVLAYIYKEYQIPAQTFLALFIVFKNFNWPINIHEKNVFISQDNFAFSYLVSLYIWMSYNAEASLIWGTVWLFIAVFLSLGSGLIQTLLLMSLAMVSINQQLAILASLLVMAVYLKEKFNYFLLLPLTFSGLYIFKETITQNEIIWALPILFAVALARLIINEVKTIDKFNVRQQILSLVFLLGLLIGSAALLEYDFNYIATASIIFALVLMFFILIFNFVYKSKPSFFVILKKDNIIIKIFKKIESTDLYQITKHEELILKDRALFEKFISVSKENTVILVFITFICVIMFLRAHQW